jgi:hypothetical protein
MIAIVNMGPHDDSDEFGWWKYEIRINADVVCTFRHRRADGLGRCLLEASKAVERQRWAEAERMLDIANEMQTCLREAVREAEMVPELYLPETVARWRKAAGMPPGRKGGASMGRIQCCD